MGWVRKTQPLQWSAKKEGDTLEGIFYGAIEENGYPFGIVYRADGSDWRVFLSREQHELVKCEEIKRGDLVRFLCARTFEFNAINADGEPELKTGREIAIYVADESDKTEWLKTAKISL